MTIREQFKRAVIEGIHGMSYEEAIQKEVHIYERILKNKYCVICKRVQSRENKLCEFCNTNNLVYTTDGLFERPPITMGRVMAALALSVKRESPEAVVDYGYFADQMLGLVYWKLLNDDGTECTDDDQSEEAIEKLLELLT